MLNSGLEQIAKENSDIENLNLARVIPYQGGAHRALADVLALRAVWKAIPSK